MTAVRDTRKRKHRHDALVPAICAWCYERFAARASEIKIGRGKCCSWNCAQAYRFDQQRPEEERRAPPPSPEKHGLWPRWRCPTCEQITTVDPCAHCGSAIAPPDRATVMPDDD